MGYSKQTLTFCYSGFKGALILLLLSGCSNQKTLPNWLCGKWNSSYDGIAITETWVQGENQLTGTTLWQWDDKRKNNTRREDIKLFYQSDSLIYRVKMDRNKEIDFVCTDSENDTLIFINNSNDFPKRVVYVQPTTKRMTVWIDNEKGDPNKIDFPFLRE